MKIKLNIRDILADHWDDSVQVTATVDLEDLFQCLNLDDQPEFDLDEILEENRMIAHVWSIEDVHEKRPGLTDEQAWEVLQTCDRKIDREQGLSWETLEATADRLFGAPNDRVERFGKFITDYTDYDAKTNLVDLLADGLHWSQANSVDFDESLQTARTHFRAESTEGDKP
jgi:hypothetical protein